MSTSTLTPGVPVGTIVAFAGQANRIPRGWVECNGVQLDKTAFPKLFEAIGTVWGGSGTPHFFLPDLRGMFLRGVSGDTDRDPEKNDRYSPQLSHAPSNPGNRGNDVGSLQNHAFKIHTHRPNLGGNFLMDGNSGSPIANYFVPAGGGGALKYWGTTAEEGQSAAETRPINANVFYIIRVDE